MEPPECLDLLDNLEGDTKKEQLESLSKRVEKIMKRAAKRGRISRETYEKYKQKVK